MKKLLLTTSLIYTSFFYSAENTEFVFKSGEKGVDSISVPYKYAECLPCVSKEKHSTSITFKHATQTDLQNFAFYLKSAYAIRQNSNKLVEEKALYQRITDLPEDQLKYFIGMVYSSLYDRDKELPAYELPLEVFNPLMNRILLGKSKSEHVFVPSVSPSDLAYDAQIKIWQSRKNAFDRKFAIKKANFIKKNEKNKKHLKKQMIPAVFESYSRQLNVSRKLPSHPRAWFESLGINVVKYLHASDKLTIFLSGYAPQSSPYYGYTLTAIKNGVEMSFKPDKNNHEFEAAGFLINEDASMIVCHYSDPCADGKNDRGALIINLSTGEKTDISFYISFYGFEVGCFGQNNALWLFNPQQKDVRRCVIDGSQFKGIESIDTSSFDINHLRGLRCNKNGENLIMWDDRKIIIMDKYNKEPECVVDLPHILQSNFAIADIITSSDGKKLCIKMIGNKNEGPNKSSNDRYYEYFLYDHTTKQSIKLYSENDQHDDLATIYSDTSHISFASNDHLLIIGSNDDHNNTITYHFFDIHSGESWQRHVKGQLVFLSGNNSIEVEKHYWKMQPRYVTLVDDTMKQGIQLLTNDRFDPFAEHPADINKRLMRDLQGLKYSPEIEAVLAAKQNDENRVTLTKAQRIMQVIFAHPISFTFGSLALVACLYKIIHQNNFFF